MATLKACPHCGAPVTRKEMTVCWSCGTPYAFGQDKEKAPTEQRFAAADEAPQLADLLQRTPSLTPGIVHLSVGLGIALIVTILAQLLGGLVAPAIGVAFLRWIVLIASFLAFLLGCIWVLVKLIQIVMLMRSEKVTRLALVTRKATVKEGGKLSDAQGKPLIIHLEFRTENRDQVRAAGPLAEKIQVGDIGVAYVRGRYLLDFQKVEV